MFKQSIQPFKIINLLFGNDNQLLSQVSFDESPGWFHDIKDQYFVRFNFVIKVCVKARNRLCSKCFGALSEDNGDIKAPIEGFRRYADECARFPGLNTSKQHPGPVLGCLLTFQAFCNFLNAGLQLAAIVTTPRKARIKTSSVAICVINSRKLVQSGF